MKNEGLERRVGDALSAAKQTLSVAESCTGGLLGSRITDVPGSSEYFMGGVIAYSYQAKEDALGVLHETLTQYGAVSEETALEMARGARRLLGTDFSLSITGIAGPGGGMPHKPVGLVYIALVWAGGELCRRFVWGGDRIENKELSVDAALEMLLAHLEQEGA